MHLTKGGAVLSLAHLASVARAATSTCVAGQPCTPNYNAADCGVIEQNWTNGSFREQTYGALAFTTWQSCGDDTCDPSVFVPQGPNCTLGRLSPLYVEAETPEDITATFAFVEQTGVELVVKNTGHDYLGRSAAANTLALWTHKFQNKTYEPSFTAYNCSAAGNKQNVGIIGAGVVAEDAINFFDKYGMMITTGGCSTVGIAGGFGQGGGHGPLGPTYGLMVDQAIEFDVVTPDGVYRTINECNDADLFWAMRGGGGSSYAILVNYKLQLYPQTQWATWRVEATVTPTSTDVTEDTVLRDVLLALANNQTSWTENRVSGYDVVVPTQVSMLEILPGENSSEQLQNLTAAFNTYITSHPGLNVTTNTYATYDSEAEFYAGQEAYLSSHAILGISAITPSRLITADNFASESKVDALVTAVLQALQVVQEKLGAALAAQVNFVILKTAPFNTPDSQGTTSANPVWRNTLWHFTTAGAWVPGTPTNTSGAIAGAAMSAIDIVKQPLATQASYHNEASVDETDWESLFWGENYQQLLDVKQKYDPKTLLNCKKCVGYTGAQDQRYSCYSKTPVPSVPYPFTN